MSLRPQQKERDIAVIFHNQFRQSRTLHKNTNIPVTAQKVRALIVVVVNVAYLPARFASLRFAREDYDQAKQVTWAKSAVDTKEFHLVQLYSVATKVVVVGIAESAFVLTAQSAAKTH